MFMSWYMQDLATLATGSPKKQFSLHQLCRVINLCQQAHSSLNRNLTSYIGSCSSFYCCDSFSLCKSFYLSQRWSVMKNFWRVRMYLSKNMTATAGRLFLCFANQPAYAKQIILENFSLYGHSAQNLNSMFGMWRSVRSFHTYSLCMVDADNTFSTSYSKALKQPDVSSLVPVLLIEAVRHLWRLCLNNLYAPNLCHSHVSIWTYLMVHVNTSQYSKTPITRTVNFLELCENEMVLIARKLTIMYNLQVINIDLHIY